VGQLIDGKAVAAAVRSEVRERVSALARRGLVPGLATVLVGNDSASRLYVGNKRKACEEVGIRSLARELPADVSQAELEALVRNLGANPDVHGILVQLPLPAPLKAERVLEILPPDKDVDGLTTISEGRLLAGLPGLRPCTPLGALRLIDETGTMLKGAQAVVVGRSLLVGKPVALLLLERHATVTLCHSRTRDLGAEVSRADVVVAATGQAGLVRGAWIKPGAVVIDVGINRGPDGKLCGDVEFAAARERAGYITPVPGGVGPMTVAMLLANTATAAERVLSAV
jgi:methylenetetrahydrofolate dehydrogenase (NADP+)/methenyltetrahydrofolate cyclohydrolase